MQAAPPPVYPKDRDVGVLGLAACLLSTGLQQGQGKAWPQPQFPSLQSQVSCWVLPQGVGFSLPCLHSQANQGVMYCSQLHHRRWGESTGLNAVCFDPWLGTLHPQL